MKDRRGKIQAATGRHMALGVLHNVRIRQGLDHNINGHKGNSAGDCTPHHLLDGGRGVEIPESKRHSMYKGGYSTKYHPPESQDFQGKEDQGRHISGSGAGKSGNDPEEICGWHLLHPLIKEDKWGGGENTGKISNHDVWYLPPFWLNLGV